jgi:hypothetical protein
MAAPFIDKAGVIDGGLFVFGTRTSRGIDAFVDQIDANVKQFHGCTEPAGRRRLTVSTAPGVRLTDRCVGQLFARVVAARKGFGLAVFVAVNQDREAVALDELIQWLAGLKWRPD